MLVQCSSKKRLRVVFFRMKLVIHWRILLLCFPVFFLHNHQVSGQCKDHEQEALLQLKNGFFNVSPHSSIATWRPNIDCCKWEGVTCNKDTGKVVRLDINNSYFMVDGVSSKVPISLTKLSSLQYLNISSCYLMGYFPEQVFSFKNLTDLDVSYNQHLKVVIPELPKTSVLRSLKLSSTNLSWTSVASLSKLDFLTTLQVSYCDISGYLPYWISTLRSLVYLDMSDNHLVGDIGSLQNHTELVHLDLSYNDFNGSVLSLQNLTKLVHLDLSANDFNGIIPSLQNLTKLVHLDLSANQLSGNILSLQNLTKLVHLALAFNDFNGSILSLHNLTKLVHLDLSYNDFNGSVLSLQNLTELIHLTLSFNDFNGSILSLHNLKKLVHLGLAVNDFNGSILSLQNLTELVDLDLSYNGFNGNILSLHNLTKLVHLDLSVNHLNGNILSSHTELVTTPKLSYLALGSNQLTGPIPKWIFQLKNLEMLFLQHNNFSGTLDLQLFSNLQNLSFLDLSYNNLFLVNPRRDFTLNYFNKISYLRLRNCKLNEFPSLISSDGGLGYLDLSQNNISGKIPSWIWNAMRSSIGDRRLNLSHNSLEGFEEPQYNISSIKFYFLDLSNNQLLGEISEILGANFERAFYISLEKNKLFGKIPETICNAQYLQTFDLSHNNLNGTIPQCIGKLNASLSILNLKNNNFNGKIPETICNAQKLLIFDLSHNNLYGTIPQCIGELNASLSILNLKNNNFNGKIPETICNAHGLGIFDLSQNNLNGTIPQCIGELSASLIILNLKNNNFNGKIPQSYGKDCQLKTLNLNGNQFEGDIPSLIENCKQLEVLDLGNNQLSGTFPFWLESLTVLRVLVLRSNRFHGEIFTNINYSFPSLQIMDISSNNFIGTISLKCFQSLKTPSEKDNSTQMTENRVVGDSYYTDSVTLTKGRDLDFQYIIIGLTTAIDLSNNRFQGEIPKDIGELRFLRLLNISWNLLTGPIPQSIGNLTLLESLDLSKNNLSGRIPSQLTSLTFLSTLNLSMNNFEGRIPESNQLDTFNEESFVGNPKLCGKQLRKRCSGNSQLDMSPTKGSSFSFTETIWFTFLFGFVAGLIIGVLFWNIVPSKRLKTHVNHR